MANHTPGPWHSCGGDITDDQGFVLASLDCVCTRSTVRERARNARLIAAAPDLLEACKMIVAQYDYIGGHVDGLREARAAIAKAEGK